MKKSSRRKLLIEALKHLASQPPAQIDYLGSFGTDSADELALQFDDIAAARNDMLAMGELTLEEFNEIASLDGLLARISGKANSRLWTFAALAKSTEWQSVRGQAKHCLHLMQRTEPS